MGESGSENLKPSSGQQHTVFLLIQSSDNGGDQDFLEVFTIWEGVEGGGGGEGLGIQFNSIQFIVTKQSCTQIEQSLNSNRICDNEDETQGVCVLSLLQPNI